MLNELFPRRSSRFRALRLLGPLVDEFDTWLSVQGYRRSTRRLQARALVWIDRDLRQHGVRPGATWKQADLDACWRRCHIDDPNTGGTIHALRRFLHARSELVITPPAVTRVATLAKIYGVALEELRGFSPLTIRQHVTTATDFLTDVGYEIHPERLGELTASDVEVFVRRAGQRLQRASLQHTIAQLRGFLRFLTSHGRIRPGLDQQIDTPRVYRQETLPRSLSWPTVLRLLSAIDRRTALGLRDYTMLFLIATYGLRTSEIVALTLDAIDWREHRLHVPQRKTRTALVLPLTDAVGTVLLRYLQRGRPASPHRELFLRHRAPAGVLKPTAVSEVFQQAVRRSGLPIPFHGPHCLRHSYAVSLLRRGVGLKTLGDLLGHRTAEATCAYLRLATDDLREVALVAPATASAGRRS